MALLEELVYCLCVGDSGSVPVCGWVIEEQGEDLILGTVPVTGVGNAEQVKVGSRDIGFVRVAADSVSKQLPSDWAGVKASQLPDLGSCKAAWKKVTKAIQSSETEPVVAEVRKSTRPKGLAAELAGLQSLFSKGGGDDDDTEDDDEDLPPRASRSGFLAPGHVGSDQGKGRARTKGKEEEPDFKKMIVAGLSAGQSPSDLMPIMMLSMLLDKGRGSKGRKDRGRSSRDDLGVLGGSASESSSEDESGGRGMKAMNTLHRMHRQIKERPRRVCELFEREVIEELGIVKGQAWTLRDYVKKQQWGKFKGIFRTAMMDVAVYERLRANQPDVAAAQVVQNLKAKIQCALQGGEWTSAWLLTGLADPLHRKDFAGAKEEMSVVSGYLDALQKLQKRMKDTKGNHVDEDEDPAAQGSGARK